MNVKHLFNNLGSIFKSAFKGFSDDKVLKLSGSLAYTMVFSMGPLILIIITTSSFFFGREAIEGKIYGQLEGFLGHDTALQLQDIIKHAAISGKSNLATVIGIIFLFIPGFFLKSRIQ
ncbi:MAG TPA: YhjD/YihY/BrkB family envelope integrity protein [Puia sp.]|nr:YhjD/YihY/BrkB family envelope integrity protein [Puia sp.]